MTMLSTLVPRRSGSYRAVTRCRRRPVTVLLLMAVLVAGSAILACAGGSGGEAEEGTAAQPEGEPAASAAAPSGLALAPDDDGLVLPEGFRAVVVAEGVGRARHLVVDGEGDVYVRLRDTGEHGGLVALRDTDGDGRADEVDGFTDDTGTGVDIHDGQLYYSTTLEVFRVPLAAGELVPSGTPEVVVESFPRQGQHATKSFAFDESGHLFVNVGAPSNACQEESRTEGSPGLDPCPQLERQAGVWRFDADRVGQTQAGDGTRFAAGIRNSVALAWNPAADRLYAVQHGRDQLAQLWPDLYTVEESAELPAEELFLLQEGASYGWPYCYYDSDAGEKVLAPEYGGDTETVGRCDQHEDPIKAFPGHWGPNDLLFYDGGQFPERYQDGAFIAFHGSWNRAPEPQAGYNVAFVPFDGERPSGEYEVFADGFARTETIRTPGDAAHRPTGLALGPDGSLYVSDSIEGRIWRIVYTGDTDAGS